MDALGNSKPIRLGAVRYLNARPLVFALPKLAPKLELQFDVPSRLADRLASGHLDVAMIPSIEYFRLPGAVIVSDACIACRGPVRSVMLYGRKPVQELRSVAVDEGSRTSAALLRILLSERCGLQPEYLNFPIGSSVLDSDADAVMLIGDRGMLEPPGDFAFVWDLGEEWNRWTGLPFVFSMWVARPGVDLKDLDDLLCEARDDGLKHLEEIAKAESAQLGISPQMCLTYLRDHLRFFLGQNEWLGLARFGRLAKKHQLIPETEGPFRWRGKTVELFTGNRPVVGRIR